MSRLSHLRIGVTRSARILFWAFRDFIKPPKPFEGLSTADWHRHPPEGHPSTLCKCPDGGNGSPYGEHEADCPWLAAMCDECHGEGTCSECGGDGCKRPEDVKLHPFSKEAQELRKVMRDGQLEQTNYRCKICKDLGWYETGNSDLICECEEGRKLRYNERGQIVYRE